MVITASATFLDDRAVIERVFAHLDRGTTDLASTTWREPVENFRSPRRFAAETAMLRGYPTVMCPSAALPEGGFVARDVFGTPIVVTRDRDGTARGFRNVCRHRGTVVATGSGCTKSLVCPYHGWVYGLDGALRRVPDEHGFPGIDKATRGLVELQAVERAGMVFVSEDTGSDARAQLGALPDLSLAGYGVVAHSENVVDANWKVLLEGFLEGYHLRATHPTTFLPFGYDNVNVVETSGRCSRVTFPFRRIEALRDRPRSEWSTDGLVTFVTHLFPNTIVAQLSHHTTVVVLEPVTVDRTNFVTCRLVRGGGNDRAAAESAERDVSFVEQGAIEDRDVALAVQRGLAGGANESLEFGLFEGAITHFHRTLHELLGDAI